MLVCVGYYDTVIAAVSGVIAYYSTHISFQRATSGSLPGVIINILNADIGNMHLQLKSFISLFTNCYFKLIF